MKAYNTPKDELHIESDTGETLVSITPDKTTIANLEGGGDKLYAHYIQLPTSSLNANLILITKSETAFTLETLANYLTAYTNTAPFYGVTGVYGNTYNVGTGNGVQIYAANSIYVSSGSLYVKINTTKIPVTDTANPGTNITFTAATGIIDEVQEI